MRVFANLFLVLFLAVGVHVWITRPDIYLLH
jgi:hypothetical protein